MQVTKFVEKHSKEISPSTVQRPSEKNPEQSIPDAKPEKPPRFEPSYNVVAPTQNHQQGYSEKTDANISNADPQPKIQSVEYSVPFPVPLATRPAGNSNNENNQQQTSLHQPDISQKSTIVTKEVFKPLPAVKPTANNSFRIETPRKAQPKQSPGASFISKNVAKPEPSTAINISIGRIEVHVSQPPVTSAAKPRKEGVAIMGLEEYLQKRNQRGQ
jgi:hypothetical protein